ncbi:cysteine-rich protein 2-binding protein [Stigmatopora nigra]
MDGGPDDRAACLSVSEGLEEGEVEGETLLIVESEDRGSLDLSHEHSGDSLASEEADAVWACDDLAFYCERCHKWLSAAHLHGNQPSYLKGDNFFRFVCRDCSEDGQETFERMRLTWQQVVMLAMYNLSLEGTGRQGYFRWKEDICAFIGRHWNFLLGSRKKTSTWWSTVAGCLSVGSPAFFRSGAQEFNEPGWWKLVHNRPPTLRAHKAGAKVKGERASPCSHGTGVRRVKGTACKTAAEPTVAPEGLRRRGGGSRNPLETATQLKEKRSRTQEAKDIRRAQKEAGPAKARGAGTKPRPPDQALLEKGEVPDFSSSLSSSDRTPPSSPSPPPSPDFSAPGTPASRSATPGLLSEADLIPDAMPPQALFHGDEEMEADPVIDPGTEYAPLPTRKKSRPPPPRIKREADSEDDGDGRRGDFEDQAEGPRPERKGAGCADKSPGEGLPRHAPAGPYRERMLRRRLEACPLALAVTPQARRLRRKLLVRQAKRQRGLPLLDIDRALGLAVGVYDPPAGERCLARDLRILDRFQVKSWEDGRGGRNGFLASPQLSFSCRLSGADGASEQAVKSPYTSRLLKPYIRRDYESRPLKMRLLAEIRAHPHRREAGWIPRADAPLDYRYVRPAHIPSVNAMCRHGFWPGVDLSECLRYPDFSVVALYKKVVVGFGFMVPDVKYNEAYVSFLMVHPEWRRAGIGTFMIYHLIQTCMGKDVTLHVSASNPAMMLYRKFGFQAEEYILDFYDKYYAIDSGECRHAFFLRLRR